MAGYAGSTTVFHLATVCAALLLLVAPGCGGSESKGRVLAVGTSASCDDQAGDQYTIPPDNPLIPSVVPGTEQGDLTGVDVEITEDAVVVTMSTVEPIALSPASDGLRVSVEMRIHQRPTFPEIDLPDDLADLPESDSFIVFFGYRDANGAYEATLADGSAGYEDGESYEPEFEGRTFSVSLPLGDLTHSAPMTEAWRWNVRSAVYSERLINAGVIAYEDQCGTTGDGDAVYFSFVGDTAADSEGAAEPTPSTTWWDRDAVESPEDAFWGVVGPEVTGAFSRDTALQMAYQICGAFDSLGVDRPLDGWVQTLGQAGLSSSEIAKFIEATTLAFCPEFHDDLPGNSVGPSDASTTIRPSTSTSTPAAPPTGPVVLSTTGVGDVAFGTPEESASTRLAALLGEPERDGPHACPQGPGTYQRWTWDTVAVMLINGRLAFWFASGDGGPDSIASEPVSIGMTMEQATAASGGGITVQPPAYTEDGAITRWVIGGDDGEAAIFGEAMGSTGSDATVTQVAAHGPWADWMTCLDPPAPYLY